VQNGPRSGDITGTVDGPRDANWDPLLSRTDRFVSDSTPCAMA